jgi:hypothetical protein
VRNFPDYQEIIHMDNAWLLISKEQIHVVLGKNQHDLLFILLMNRLFLEFIRKQFGPSLSKTDLVIRTSLSTMVRAASWKLRGGTCVVHPDGNATQLSGQDDNQIEEENEEEE